MRRNIKVFESMNIKFHCQAFLRYSILHKIANIILQMKKRLFELLNLTFRSNYCNICLIFLIWYYQMKHGNIDAGVESFSYYQKCNSYIIQNIIM